MKRNRVASAVGPNKRQRTATAPMILDAVGTLLSALLQSNQEIREALNGQRYIKASTAQCSVHVLPRVACKTLLDLWSAIGVGRVFDFDTMILPHVGHAGQWKVHRMANDHVIIMVYHTTTPPAGTDA